MTRKTTFALCSAVMISSAIFSTTAAAAIVISEVDPAGSGASYAADWFEITNTGSGAVNLVGWTIDDSSNAVATSFPLRGLTSLPGGRSAVLLENGTDGTADAAKFASFEAAWFGSNIPSGFLIGAYGGAGLGLSTSGDGVNLFDSTGTPVVGVSFGAAPAGATFDNATGASGVISTASVVGVNGAFTSAASSEVGSPGATANTPEPVATSMLALAGGLLARRKRH